MNRKPCSTKLIYRIHLRTGLAAIIASCFVLNSCAITSRPAAPGQHRHHKKSASSSLTNERVSVLTYEDALALGGQHNAAEIHTAYLKAYSAQTLLPVSHELQSELTQSEANLNRAIADKLLPKEGLLKFRSAMLAGHRQLIELTEQLAKANTDLKQELNLPPSTRLQLQAPSAFVANRLNSLWSHDYLVAEKQVENTHRIYVLTRDRHLASMASSQEVVYARLQSVLAEMQKELILAKMPSNPVKPEQ